MDQHRSWVMLEKGLSFKGFLLPAPQNLLK